MLLAEYFYEQCAKIDGIEPGPRPDLSIITFRFCPDETESDDASRALFKTMQQDTRVFIASTTIAGRFTIRMAILTYHTHLEDIDLALQVIRESAIVVRKNGENSDYQ